MKLWRWEKGRQNSGYEKFFVLGSKWPIPFDFYILRFKEGTEIPPHTDTVSAGEHYRLNIVLKKAKSGGEFLCSSPIFENTRVKYFRPDLAEHSVSRVMSGTRYVLSVGWVRHA